MDWITGEKFQAIADYAYAPAQKHQDDYYDLVNTFDVELLKDKDIIFTYPFYVKQLFDIIKQTDKKLIIITHNGDENIDESYELPDNVIKWYAQNVNVRNPRIESIPIGLENERWFQFAHKKEKMLAKVREPRLHKNLAYMNFNVGNNPEKRVTPYRLFRFKSWVTVDMGINGYNFDNYIDNIYNHSFVICPEGHGMDTHRIWETLYMGSIPIVENNINNQFYTHLPIFPVNDWREVTDERLQSILSNSDFDYLKWRDTLTFEYWKNKIKDCR